MALLPRSIRCKSAPKAGRDPKKSVLCHEAMNVSQRTPAFRHHDINRMTVGPSGRFHWALGPRDENSRVSASVFEKARLDHF